MFLFFSFIFLFYFLFLLYFAHLCMKCSLGTSNFLEEISSLSHSVVFLFLCTDRFESFLISPCYSSDGYIFLFLLCLSLLFFSQLFVRSPETTILPFCISFSGRRVLITASCTMSQTSNHSSSGTLSNLSLESTGHFHCIIVRDLI